MNLTRTQSEYPKSQAYKVETGNITVDFNLNEEPTESPNREEEPMSYEV